MISSLLALKLYFDFAGIELVVSQGECHDTNVLPFCTKYQCMHLCEHSHGIASYGECKDPFTCRCHFHCPTKIHAYPPSTK